MSIVNKLTLSQNGFMMQIDGHNMDSLSIAQQQFAEHSKTSLDEINKVEAFAEKADYRNTAVEYIKTVNSLATHESKQMVEIMAKDSAQLTEADLVKVAQLSAKFDADYEKAFNTLEAAQSAFAKEWKFGIERTKR